MLMLMLTLWITSETVDLMFHGSTMWQSSAQNRSKGVERICAAYHTFLHSSPSSSSSSSSSSLANHHAQNLLLLQLFRSGFRVVQLGQALSIRPDVIGPAATDELGVCMREIDKTEPTVFWRVRPCLCVCLCVQTLRGATYLSARFLGCR